MFIVIHVPGDCVVQAANDKCGLNSVPLICNVVSGVIQSTKCLCNSGVRTSANNTCLGE